MARRRRRTWGEGSVYKRSDGQWASSLSVTQPDGSRKRIVRYSENETEARIKLREIQASRANAGPTALMSRETMREFSERWLAGLELAPATLDSYRRALENHILRGLGDMEFRQVAPAHVHWWLTERLQAGVGGRTRQLALSVLRAMCSSAVTLKVIPLDPTAGIRRPKAEREDIVPFTEEEVGKILGAAQSHRLFALFLMAFYLAVRQEELFGLQWSDIDLEAKTLRLRRAVAEVAGKATVKELKTKRSKRVLPLPDCVVEALELRQKQAMREGHAGEPWVFLSRRGTLLRRSNFANRQWKPLLKAAGVKPHRGLHHARHTTATRLLQAEVPVHVVSGLLGHGKASTTTDIYAHFLPEDQTAAKDAISNRIGYKLATDSAAESRKAE